VRVLGKRLFDGPTGATFRLTTTGSPARSPHGVRQLRGRSSYRIILAGSQRSELEWHRPAVDLGLFGGTGCSQFPHIRRSCAGIKRRKPGITFMTSIFVPPAGAQRPSFKVLIDGAIPRPPPVATSNYLKVTIQA
jgi:hypothetical protein